MAVHRNKGGAGEDEFAHPGIQARFNHVARTVDMYFSHMLGRHAGL